MRRTLFKLLAGTALAELMVGCAAVPPVAVVASQAADGISYIATGRSGSDHALSAALNEDCALYRVLIGKAVCRPAEKDFQTASLSLTADAAPAAGELPDDGSFFFGAGVQAAAQSPAPSGDRGTMSGLGTPGADMFFAPSSAIERFATPARSTLAAPSAPMLAEAAEAAAVPSVVEPVTVTAAPAPSVPIAARPAPRHFVVLGSFATSAGARRATTRITESVPLDPEASLQVKMGRRHGRTMYRVVLGPVDSERAADLYNQYVDAGYGPTWAVPACAEDAATACIVE